MIKKIINLFYENIIHSILIKVILIYIKNNK